MEPLGCRGSLVVLGLLLLGYAILFSPEIIGRLLRGRG
jgi:hypothetical protein